MAEENIEEIVEMAIEAGEKHGDGPARRWIEWATLSTMLMALFAAIGGLLAGITANEALINRQEQIVALIEKNRISLASEILLTRLQVIELKGETPSAGLLAKTESAREVAKMMSARADRDLKMGERDLHLHELFAIGTTILASAITLAGVSVIVGKRIAWYCSLGVSLIGAALVIHATAKFIG